MGELVEIRKASWKGVGRVLAEGPSNGKELAYLAGGLGGTVVAGEVVGRKVGANRYNKGKHVNDGFFMGPSVNRGYFSAERRAKGKLYGSARPGSAQPEDGMRVRKGYVSIPPSQVSPGGRVGLKRLKGAVREAEQSQWKKQLAGAGVSKADRDQNSFRSPAPTSMRLPDGKYKSSSIKANGKHESSQGRNGGVGRNLNRDQNSSPGATKVRTPTLREINGKFAGEGYGVKMYTPIGGSKRGAVHNKGIFRTTKGSGAAAVGHARGSSVRKGMLGPVELSNMQHHAGNRVGRRL